MKRRVWLGLACSLLLATSWGAEPRLGRFVKYDTGDFVIVTSRGAPQARQLMQKLAKFRLTLEKLLGRRAGRSGIGTHIIIVGEGEWQRYLQPREGVAGFFQRAPFDNYMALNGDAGEFAVYVMFHEYTHFFLATQFAGEYPPWFDEGLAEVMAYAKFKDQGTVLQNPGFRAAEARDKDWIPFDKLITISRHSPEYLSHSLAESFYAQAWLTVHYGLLENRDFGRRFFEYLNHLNQLVPQREAASRAFGTDLAAIDADLRAYARKNQKFSGAVDLGEVPEVALPEAQPMSDADALAVLIDVMLATRAAPDRIRPLIESLQRREPQAARGYILAARLAEFDDQPQDFEAAVVEAGQRLAADDWQGQRDLGTVLLNNADDVTPLSPRSDADIQKDLKRAFHWYAKSVERHNADPESLWGLGTTLTRLEIDLELAETALLAARQRVPASARVAISLANLKSRQRKPEEMVPYLQEAIRYASDLQTRRWATSTLEEIEEFLAERAKAAEQKPGQTRKAGAQ